MSGPKIGDTVETPSGFLGTLSNFDGYACVSADVDGGTELRFLHWRDVDQLTVR